MAGISATGRIVAGLDGSVAARTAAEWAARRAQAQGVGLTLVAVLSPLQVPRSLTQMLRQKAVDYTERLVAASREKLQAAAAEVRAAHPALDVAEVLVEDSEPAVVLVEASADALLVVTGARGIGTAKPMALGSVSRHLVTHARGPVAIVPETGLASEPGVAGTVVVGVQDVELSQALPVAVDEANRLGGRLVVVHTWEYSPVAIDGLPAMDSMLFERARDELTTTVDEQVRARVQGSLTVPLETRVELGNAAEVLTEVSHQADLVVVGARASSGLRGMLLGSTAIGVLKHSISPVLVVPVS